MSHRLPPGHVRYLCLRYATCANLPDSPPSLPPPHGACGCEINRGAYFLHIIVIALQDKHLIPVNLRGEQMNRGLLLSAPQPDDIELDYGAK